jgi:RimJ/RimL family protein N-acetyltransferase
MFARTERLILRPSWPEDATPLARALSNPDVSRNLTSVPAHYDEAEAQAWIQRPRDPRLPEFLAFLRTRGAPRLVGGAGISQRADGGLELGYWVERSHWGLGFATEATRAVMRVARATGIIAVRSGHFLDNPSSARVLRKLGFRPTGQVEPRLSQARASEVQTALFEYDEASAPAREDAAFELYHDATMAMA